MYDTIVKIFDRKSGPQKSRNIFSNDENLLPLMNDATPIHLHFEENKESTYFFFTTNDFFFFFFFTQKKLFIKNILISH